MLAAHNGHISVLKTLLKNNANPNTIAADGCTALLCSSQGGFVDCVKELLAHKADVDPKTKPNFPTPLYTSSQDGYGSIVKILLQAKADMNRAVEDVSCLFIAAQEGHKECVNEILRAGANVNFENRDHASPLFIAAQKGHTAITASLLKDSRVIIDDPTKDGTTPLLISIQIGNLDDCTTLIKAGADIERSDNAGNTPLLTAAKYGDMDVVDLLIQNGVDLQKAGPDGRTAHVILKDEFGEDLLKIAAQHRRTSTNGTKALPKTARPTRATSKRHDTGRLHERLYNKAHDLFAKFDVDNDKTLGKQELRECLVALGCEKKLGKQKFDALLKHSFAKFDKNNDGVIGIDEFLRLYAVLMGQYKKMKREHKKRQARKIETDITTVKIVTTPKAKHAEGDHAAAVDAAPALAKRSPAFATPPPINNSNQPGGAPPPPKSKSNRVPPPPIHESKKGKASGSRTLEVTRAPPASKNEGNPSNNLKLPAIRVKNGAQKIQW